MKKIFLHVGYWKCGSTYIQIFCNKNKKNLVLHNIHYDAFIKSKRLNGVLVPTLHEVGNFLLQNDLESAKRLLNKIIIDSKEKNIILSGENMMNVKVVSLLNELFRIIR